MLNFLKNLARFLLGICGKLLVAKKGYNKQLLQNWSDQSNLSLFQKLIFLVQREALMMKYYSQNTTTKKREFLKALCIGGNSGLVWAKRYTLLKIDEKYMYREKPMFNWLDNLIVSGNVKCVHQVGVSSGREIAYFAQKYPFIKFVGSDAYQEVVQFANKHWKHIENLTFVKLNLADKEDINQIDCDVIVMSGVLPYLDKESLLNLFAGIRNSIHHLLIGEQISKNMFKKQFSQSTQRHNFQWHHPYIVYLKQTGWSIVNEEKFIENKTPKSLSVHATW